jgi:hypothetical protein
VRWEGRRLIFLGAHVARQYRPGRIRLASNRDRRAVGRPLTPGDACVCARAEEDRANQTCEKFAPGVFFIRPPESSIRGHHIDLPQNCWPPSKRPV